VTSEYRHHTHDPIVDDQRIAGKSHHPFALGPSLSVHLWIANDLVGQMWLPCLGDPTHLELSDRHPAVRSIEMGIHTDRRCRCSNRSTSTRCRLYRVERERG